MSNRTTSSLSISCTKQERDNIARLAAELEMPIPRALHRAIRQSLKAIGIDPDEPEQSVTRAFERAEKENK